MHINPIFSNYNPFNTVIFVLAKSKNIQIIPPIFASTPMIPNKNMKYQATQSAENVDIIEKLPKTNHARPSELNGANRERTQVVNKENKNARTTDLVVFKTQVCTTITHARIVRPDPFMSLVKKLGEVKIKENEAKINQCGTNTWLESKQRRKILDPLKTLLVKANDLKKN
jgi:hypothetical protein